MENQTELVGVISENWQLFRELVPGITPGYDSMTEAAYAGGRLDSKTKRLMALAVAVACRCRACMLYQTDHALALGADAEEVLEACAVAVSLGGTMAAGETTRVVQYLGELGILPEKA